MSLRESCSAMISGVATSVHLDSDHVAVDGHREGVDGDVGRKVQRAAGAQVEQRTVPGALDGALLRVDRALEEDPVVMRAAVLDRVDVAAAVDHADLEVLHLYDARGAGRQLGDGADVDDGAHDVKSDLYGRE